MARLRRTPPWPQVRAVAALEYKAALDSLDELVFHYSQLISRMSSASIYDELLSIRSYAGALLSRAGDQHGRQADLIVAAGWLSNLLAVATSYLGDHAAALVWCVDAERRGLEAGHPELAGWAALTQAMIAYYQGQTSRSVDLAGRGLRTAPVGTVAHAKLAAQEMRARAKLGDADGMAQARTRAATAVARLPAAVPSTGVFAVARAEDPPYTATSLLLVGQFEQAVTATGQVLDTVYGGESPDHAKQTSNYARTLLILGLAEAGRGRAAEAAAAGYAALNTASPVWPTIVLADRLDQELASRFPGVAEVAEYHRHYTDSARCVPQLATRAESRG